MYTYRGGLWRIFTAPQLDTIIGDFIGTKHAPAIRATPGRFVFHRNDERVRTVPNEQHQDDNTVLSFPQVRTFSFKSEAPHSSYDDADGLSREDQVSTDGSNISDV